jgi:hypothetical protein
LLENRRTATHPGCLLASGQDAEDSGVLNVSAAPNSLNLVSCGKGI